MQSKTCNHNETHQVRIKCEWSCIGSPWAYTHTTVNGQAHKLSFSSRCTQCDRFNACLVPVPINNQPNGWMRLLRKATSSRMARQECILLVGSRAASRHLFKYNSAHLYHVHSLDRTVKSMDSNVWDRAISSISSCGMPACLAKSQGSAPNNSETCCGVGLRNLIMLSVCRCFLIMRSASSRALRSMRTVL